MQQSIKIVCPHCDQPSDSVKKSQVWLLIFAVVGYWMQRSSVTGCSACLRRHIVRNAVINILTANIFWPFLILPHSLYQYYRTYEEGHDQNVLAEAVAISKISYHSKLGKL